LYVGLYRLPTFCNTCQDIQFQEFILCPSYVFTYNVYTYSTTYSQYEGGMTDH